MPLKPRPCARCAAVMTEDEIEPLGILFADCPPHLRRIQFQCKTIGCNNTGSGKYEDASPELRAKADAAEAANEERRRRACV